MYIIIMYVYNSMHTYMYIFAEFYLNINKNSKCLINIIDNT